MGSKPKPCRGCGGTKTPGRGSQYCEVCRDLGITASRTNHGRRKAIQRMEEDRARNGTQRRVSKAMTPEGKKWCAQCQRFLPVERFRESNGKRAAYCPPCQKAYYHDRHLQKMYGISRLDYMKMLDKQDGRCAICQRQPRKYVLAVDHDHKTGEIRGLLCSICNHKLLGSAQDSTHILRRALAYLEDPPHADGITEERMTPEERQASDELDHIISVAIEDCEREQANAGTDFGVCFVRRRGGHWVAVMSLDQWCAVAREAS